MIKIEDDKILLGNSIPLPEMDYDDVETQDHTDVPVETSALRQYYFATIINHMNNADFKSHYMAVIDKVRKMTIKQQQLLAFSIIQELPRIYDFEYPFNYTPVSDQDIVEFYNLIEFIEFKHIKFITDIWSFLKPDTSNLNIEKYCIENQEKIMKEIERHLEMSYYPESIINFLRTYSKENLIDWFSVKSKNLRSSILIKLMKGIN